ncbi:MAG: hypothetical protein H7X76_07105 [Prolixibacteraceae bacterium]|nr:hypothetical protein [Burkholderiales bacterium]
MKIALRIAIGWFALALAMDVRAALVSHNLNQSNELAGGPAYLRVSIDDQGLPGRINFNVSVLGPLIDIADHNFGIQKFGFNSAFSISSSKVTGLPSNWHYDRGGNMSGFGRFDAGVKADHGNERRSSLSFSITGISMDTIASYLQPSSGHAGNGNYFFAAHVAGFDSPYYDCVTSAYFAGSTPVSPNPVPLPGAAGLLLAGLAIAGVFGRRAKKPEARTDPL